MKSRIVCALQEHPLPYLWRNLGIQWTYLNICGRVKIEENGVAKVIGDPTAGVVHDDIVRTAIDTGKGAEVRSTGLTGAEATVTLQLANISGPLVALAPCGGGRKNAHPAAVVVTIAATLHETGTKNQRLKMMEAPGGRGKLL